MAKLGSIDDSKENFVDEDFANGLDAPDSMEMEINGMGNNRQINQNRGMSGAADGFDDDMNDSGDDMIK